MGALAVSLGVGMAVATSPGVAYADAESDPDSPSASGPSGAGPAASSAPASSSPTDSAPDTTDVDESAGSSSASESAADDGGDVPKMNVNSSGGAHTSTYGTSGTGDADPVDTSAETETVVETETGAEDETPEVVEEPPAGTSPEPVLEVPTDTSEPVGAPADLGETDGDDHDAGTPTPPSVEPAGGQSEGLQADPEPSPLQTQTLFVTDDPAPPSESTFQATSFNTLIVPSPSADPLSALLAVPGAIINVFTGFVGALLTPFLVPGPLAPAPLPGLWAVLAWVRREINHTFFNRSPIAVPIQTGQSLTGVVTGNLNAVDPNGDPLTATVTQQGQFGTVVINANGTYTYTPNGAVPAGGIIDSFKVTITDGADMHLPGIFGLVQGVFECIARFVGIAQPDTIVKTIPVTVVGSAIGLPPVIVTSPVGPIVAPNTAPVVLDSSLVITDVDSPKLSSATVKVGVGYVQGDVLAYTPTAGNPITANFNATTGVLTLSGEATLAQYQEALRSVTFASTAATLVGAKAILISATDTQNLTSLPALVAVTMLGANVPPLVVTVPVGPIVTAGSPPVALNPLVTVVDLNSPKLNGASVTITTGFTAGDVLALGPLANNPVIGTWNATTGTLTLSGEATVAQYQEALRAVTFASTTAAVIGLRTVSIVATDTQGLASLPGLVAVTVLGLPGSAPSVIATVPVKLYTSGGTPVVLDGNLTIVDVDSTTASGATVSFDPLTYDPTKDRLDFDGAGAITGVFNASTGVLELTGAGSLAEYQAALRLVTIASDATVGLRTVSIVVTADGVPSVPGLIAVTIASLPVSTNLPSVIATVPVKLYTSGGTPVVLDANVTVVDVDSTSASGATVTIGGYTAGADTLGYNGSGPISGTFNTATGVLTLTGSASIAEYQAALRSVTFSSTAGVGVKAVTIVLTADGVASAPGVVAVTVATLPVSTNLPSVIATTPVKLYTSSGTPVALDANVTIVDVDSTTASGATVTVGGGYTAGADTLGFNGSGPISGTFDAATGVLTLTGSASIAEYQAALRSVTFSSTAGVGVKAVTIVLTADGVASAPGVVAVTVATLPVSTNLPSVIATTPVKLYTSGGTPVVLDANVTIVDVDSTTASGATVTVGGYTAGADTLGFNGSGPISGTFDAATGVLTLTGSASIAEYQAALRSVTFASTAGVGLKPVTIVLTADGVASAPGLVTVTVATLPVSTNLPSVIATTPVKLYTSSGSPVVLDANVTIVDADSTSASGATVTIGGYANGVDTLVYNGSGAIGATFDAATGVLTLTGTATIEQYQAALRSVTFASTAGIGLKPVTIVLTADGVASAPGLVTVTVATLPIPSSAPSVIATTPVKLYTSGGTPVVLDANVTIVDIDSTSASGATVTIGSYANGADALTYNGSGSISGTFDAATGVLTLSGTASVADYQAALRSVTFASTAGIGLKPVTIVLTADGVASAPGLVTVTVATLPIPSSAPSVIATTPVKLYTSGGTPVVLDANVTIVDIDSTSASGATVTIGSYANGADTLTYNGSGSISGTFDAATGVLTLSGTASVADYQAALRSVTFASTAGIGLKPVTIVLTADGVASAPGLVTVTVATLPIPSSAPSVIATTPVKLYTSSGSPVVLDANVTIVDVDSTSASGATVTVGGYTAGADTLGFSGSGPISGTFDTSSGVLTLTGAASIAEYQAALRSVTFSSTAGVGVKAVTIVLTADGVASAPGVVAVTVASLPVSTNLPSVIATTPVKLYTSGGTPVVLDANVTIVDIDSTSASGATVTVGGYTAGADTLGFSGSGPISGTFDTSSGVLTLTGAASIAEYQAALRSVTFSSTAGVGVKAVTIVLTADEVASAPGLITVNVATLPVSTNLPSVIATTPAKLYTSGGSPVVLDANVTIVDADSTSASGATVTIGGYTAGVDTLAYNGSGSIGGTFDASTGVLTLTGNASIAEYQAALRSVTFSSTAGVGVKAVTIVLTADEVTSAPGLVTVTVATLPVSTNLPSVIATTPVKLYTSGGTPVVLDGNLTIVDVDSTSATGATLTIGGFNAGVDTLAYNGSGSIGGTFDASTGVLTLTGNATIEQYQAALRSVTFSSTAGVGVKAVTIVLTADEVTSAPGLVTVTVATLPIPSSAPSVIATTPVKLYTSGGTPVVLDANLTIVDIDSTSASGATVTIGSYANGADTLAYNAAGTISGIFDPATGVLTLTGNATIEQYQAALRSVTFASTAGVGVKPVTIVLVADGVASAPGLVTVTVATLPIPSSAPSVIATTPVKLYTSGGTPVVLDANLTILDIDSSSASGATVTIGGYAAGADTLGYNGSGPISGTFDAVTGVLTLTGNATIEQYQAALRSVTFASTAGVGLKPVTIVLTADEVASAPGLVTVTVATLPVSTNLPSVIATTPVKLYTSGGTPVVLDANLTIVDADSTSASGATVTIGNYVSITDGLAFSDTGSISGTFDFATGVLTLTGSASIEDYQAALRSVTFASTAGVGVKPVTIVLTADEVPSATGLVTVTVATLPVSTNLPSVIATTPVKLYTSGGTPVVLDANVTIVDADSTTASGATVTIGGYANGVDTLAYNGSGVISGTFDGVTGVLTLTGNATIEQYQAALRSVAFASTAGVGVKPVAIVLTADGVPSVTGLVTVTVATLPIPSSAPSVIATTPVKLYTSGGTPVVLDANVTIVDADSTSASGATVTIGGYTAGADTLAYNGSGVISGTFDGVTGVLTLTGNASIAEYQAALRSVTFSSTAGVGVKAVTIVLTADEVTSAPGLVTVTVATLPIPSSAPSVIATTPVKLYTSGGTPVVLDANLTVVDIDSTSANGATVTIGNYVSTADGLAFNNTGSISGTFDAATGVLTLSGTASIAEYQAALRSVTFSSTAGVGVKAVTIVLTADEVASAPGLVTVTVATLPVSTNLPSVIATTPVKLYTSGGTPVVLDANLTIVDADSTSASGATVTIGGYANGADTLAYNGSGPVSGVFDQATGVLTLTGNATIEQYQAALRSVTFASTAGVGVKAVTIVLTADGVPSATGLVSVTVATLPVSTNLPSVIATTPVKLYTSGGTPVVLDANLTIVDADSTSASGATVTIGGYTTGVDTLAYNGSGSIGATFDPATGVLTLSGTASIADYQAALRSVTFSSTASVGVKAVTIVLTADEVTSAPGLVTVTVATLPIPSSAPSVIATTPVKLYTSGGSPVVLDANVTIVDADSTSASGATVTIGGYTAGADTLAYNGAGTISGIFDPATGVLTLTGNATIEQYQAALRSVTFASTAGVGVKAVSIVLTADEVASAPGLITVTVATLPVSTNLPSVIATTPVKLYTSGGTPVVLDANLTIVDADSTTASGATVAIGGYANGVDTLAYNGSGVISGAFDGVTGVLTLTGNATIEQYQAALRSVTFASTAGVGVKPVTIVLTADGVPSATGLVTVTVATLPVATNVPAVVATSAVKLYTAGGAAMVLDPVLTVVDLDSGTVTQATVTVGGVGFDSATDSLGFVDGNGITGSWDAASGTLTLTGDASVAAYQAALRSVTFASAATALAGVRSVSVVVTADDVDSLPGVIGVTVVALPVSTNVPAVVATSAVKLYTAGGAAVVLDPVLTVVDLDSGTVTQATVTVGGVGFDSATDSLGFVDGNGITGSWDAASGTLTLTGDASVAAYQAALRSVTFASAATALAGVRSVSVVVTADDVDSLPGVIGVTVVALPPIVNVPPLVVTSLAQSYTAGAPAVVLDPSISVADLTSPTMSGATVTIGLGRNVNDVLAYTGTTPGISASWNASTGTLTLTGDASAQAYQEALRSVTFSSSAAATQGIRTVAIVVTDSQLAPSIPAVIAVTVLANQTPIIVGSLVNAVPYTVGNAPVVLDQFVTILDDSTSIQGAKVRITLGKQTGDALSFTSPSASGITMSYDSANGVLTLSGTATVEQYQAALRSVTFSTSASGIIGLRTFTFEITDQQGLAGTSLPFTAIVTANSAPLVTSSLVGVQLPFANGGSPQILDPAITILDDSTSLSGATVTIGGLVIGGNDTLAFTSPPGSGITAVWNSTTKVLSLEGNATVAEYQAALRSVTFVTSGGILGLNLGLRTVSFVVTDRQGLTSVSAPLTVLVV
ncbi:Ig-like domain-containing protein [Mycolicibacterium lacusdiani]|uniref:Ig-like domain-containing protein n=1 Tax=Mycolicibacterium lacusdiani TaxID=2895283 RepID=UPI001F284F7C|nr:Ig-like domain-containing protein [Mycolicibacterium lacusdiani]